MKMDKNENAVAAAAEDAADAIASAADTAGILSDPRAVGLGTTIISAAKGALRRQRRAVATLPQASEVLTQLAQIVKNERRRDVVVKNTLLGVCPASGRLGRKEGGKSRILRRAFIQLCGLYNWAPSRMGMYQASIPPAWRASEFEKVRARNELKARKVRFRLRTVADEEHIYATVSPSYTAYDPDELSRDLRRVLDGDKRWRDAHGYIEYCGVHVAVNLINSNPVGPGHATIRITSGDDGGKSTKVEGLVVFPSGAQLPVKKRLGRVIHSGNPERFRAAVGAVLTKADEFMAPWLEVWEDREQVKVASMHKAIRRICGDYKGAKGKPWLSLPDVKAEVLANAIIDAYTALANGKPNLATQATLARCIAQAVSALDLKDKAHESLENSAAALLAMAPAAFARVIGEAPSTTAPRNAALMGQLEMRIAKADEWRERARKAEAAGDKEGAAEATERANIHAVMQDQIAEELETTDRR